MDKETKKGLIIVLTVFAVICIVLGLDTWMRHKNKFVYEKSLDEVVLTVDGREVSLRELGYYIYYVETEVDKQARIYNPEDPLDYWNTHFSAGLSSAYVSEMAMDAILGNCVCDLIYEEMAIGKGYELTKEEEESAKKQAQSTFSAMTEKQKSVTGLSQDDVELFFVRKALVIKYAADFCRETDFSGYSGYREELISYAGEYYKEKILPLHEVQYNYEIINELKPGRITTDYEVKY